MEKLAGRWAMRGFLVLNLVILLNLAGCMTYRGYPDTSEAKSRGNLATSEPFRYEIVGSSLFNGHIGVSDVLRTESPFANPIELDAGSPVPERGVFVKVKISPLPPNIGAALWAYVNLGFFYLLPAISTQDGYQVHYHLYLNGQEQREYTYEFHRGTMIWLPMIVISWVNFFTESEQEAFEATTRQFLVQAFPQQLNTGSVAPISSAPE